MGVVKCVIEVDQEVLNRIKRALSAGTDQEAIEKVLKAFDAEVQLADFTFKDAGTFNFEELFSD
ncbi:MAG: hypothetical protein ACOC3W_11705 [Thermodesulfobacteriota bacterium]